MPRKITSRLEEIELRWQAKAAVDQWLALDESTRREVIADIDENRYELAKSNPELAHSYGLAADALEVISQWIRLGSSQQASEDVAWLIKALRSRE